MSKYIDADALIKEIKLDIADDGLTESMTFYRIMNAPSIDIVRCKECYMCDEEMWCSFYDSIMESDDFCSYGDREGE